MRARHSCSSSLLLGLAVVVAGCGSPGTHPAIPAIPAPGLPSTSSSAAPPGTSSPVATESAPPGDIPDNLAFVRFDSAAGHYSFTHPEGWTQTGSGTGVRFTDKLNCVSVDSEASTQQPTVASARTSEAARLAAQVPAFELRDVQQASLPGGAAVRLTYRQNSAPDPVTGKVYRDEVEEYLVQRSGRLVRMTLSGPLGADNVDAYRTMSRSLVIR